MTNVAKARSPTTTSALSVIPKRGGIHVDYGIYLGG